MSKELVEKLGSMEECLAKFIESQFSIDGIHAIACNPQEVEIYGEMIDMLKDIADAKKNCTKAKYYETVTKAMEEYDEEENDREGYNNRRYANGRYAPSGRGSIRGGYRTMPPMGYDVNPGNTNGNVGNMNSSNNMTGGRSGYHPEEDPYYYDYPMAQSERGHHFDNYRDAKRHYTKTRSEQDKKRMHEHADEYVTNAVAAMLEIWNSADPDQKQHIKSNMTPLITGMNL